MEKKERKKTLISTASGASIRNPTAAFSFLQDLVTSFENLFSNDDDDDKIFFLNFNLFNAMRKKFRAGGGGVAVDSHHGQHCFFCILMNHILTSPIGNYSTRFVFTARGGFG